MRGVAALVAALAVWVYFGGWVPEVDRSSIRSSIRLPEPRVLGIALAWGSAAFLVVVSLSGLAILGGAVALLVAATYVASRRLVAERSRREVMEQWPDFLAILRSRLAAGRSLPEATVEAALHCGNGIELFGHNVQRSLARGAPFGKALEMERSRMSDAVADRVLTSLAFAATAGGGRVADILGLLGQSVGDELRLRRAHDAALTQQRLTAAVALAAPWALLLLTVATNPQAASTYGTAGGAKVLAVGLAMTATGFLLARRSAKLSKAARIFR